MGLIILLILLLLWLLDLYSSIEKVLNWVVGMMVFLSLDFNAIVDCYVSFVHPFSTIYIDNRITLLVFIEDV
jgi:hypothetical protein